MRSPGPGPHPMLAIALSPVEVTGAEKLKRHTTAGAPGQLAGWGGTAGPPGQLAGWGGTAGAPGQLAGWGGTAVYASNHLSYMDTPVLFARLPFQFRILAKGGLWKVPFVGWYLNRSGQVPIDARQSRAPLVAGLLRGVKTLNVRPAPGDLPRRRALPRPASSSTSPRAAPSWPSAPACPLVPLALIGTYELLPIHVYALRPRPLKIVVGDPIPTTRSHHPRRRRPHHPASTPKSPASTTSTPTSPPDPRRTQDSKIIPAKHQSSSRYLSVCRSRAQDTIRSPRERAQTRHSPPIRRGRAILADARMVFFLGRCPVTGPQ
jgi:1-acyl-sn-glycerol-3-phosphate acyltransferase